MGRAPCCEGGLKKGPWMPQEDQKLIDYIQRHGCRCWRSLPQRAGLLRCGKSCRLRWTNYLRPDIKRGKFSLEEDQTIIRLHEVMGNKWSAIASQLPGRTDNEIKNHWNTHLRKHLLRSGIDPVTHRRRMGLFDFPNISQTLGSDALGHTTTLVQDALWIEYMKIVVADIIQQRQQQPHQYDKNAGEINAAEILMRYQFENFFCNGDIASNSIMSQIPFQNFENQLGPLDNSALESQPLEQLQSHACIINDMQYSSPTSILHGVNAKLEHHASNTTPQFVTTINDISSRIPDQSFNSNEADNNMANEVSLLLQQYSKGQDINLSMAWDASTLWPENNLFRSWKSDSEPLPALASFTSSPNILNHSDVVPDASSSFLMLDVSSTAGTATSTCDGPCASTSEFLLDYLKNSRYEEF